MSKEPIQLNYGIDGAEEIPPFPRTWGSALLLLAVVMAVLVGLIAVSLIAAGG
ncbi:MAG: hypothetical protein ACREJC_20065 [Tepidisphaeraceae bacterium]